MSLREAPKLQTPSIRLLRASSTGTPYIIPAQPAASSPSPAASLPPALAPSAAPSSSPSVSVSSFSSARPATLRSRFSPAHIRINTQSRHALRDSSDRIKEEEEGKEERSSSDVQQKPPPQRQPQPQQLPARSALQLSHARPSIHTTGSRDVKLRSAAVLLSASPAVTPSSASPRSSFLPTTRLHSHSLSNFSSPHARLSQHPEDGGGSHPFFSPSSSSSRRNSLSRYNPIGNEEARGGRDAEDVAVTSSLPSSLPNVPPSLSSASASSAPDRPTSQGSWRHRRPQSLTAPFSSNAIAATTTTATALSAQLQSAQSVSPSVQPVTFTSASSSSSSTPQTTSSPPSSSSMSSSYRNASPLVSSLSPSLISSLIGESLHPAAAPLPHVHEEEAETVGLRGPPVLTLEMVKAKRLRAKDRREAAAAQRLAEMKDGREEKEMPAVLQRVVHHKSSRASGPASVPVASLSSTPPAPSPPFAPSPPRVSSHAGSAQASPPSAASPLPPVGSAPFALTSFPHLSSSASPSSPLPFSPSFPVDDGHPYVTVRIARRSRVTGSLMLMSPQETLQAWEAGDGSRGRGGSLPSSHWRDFSTLSAINAITQHAAAQAQAAQTANAAVPVSNQG